MVDFKFDKNKIQIEVNLKKAEKIVEETENIVKEGLENIYGQMENMFFNFIKKVDEVVEEVEENLEKQEKNKTAQESTMQNKNENNEILFENPYVKITRKENIKEVVLWIYFAEIIPTTILENTKINVVETDKGILKEIQAEGNGMVFGIKAEEISKEPLNAKSFEIKFKKKKHAYRIFIKKV